jgi:hypothetical protein
VSLGAFAALWAARWATFPLVLDPYYHLLIARQLADAGGPIAHEWWEYAPVGRPHLYPPLLHLILAALLKAGCPSITAIRLVSVLLPVLLLASVYLVIRRIVGSSAALHCLWAGLVPFTFHLHMAITLAATLGMIELLWLVDALARGRRLAAGLWLALLCYTHLGMPWVALLTLACYGALQPSAWRRMAAPVGWGLLLAAPWLAHVARHGELLRAFPRHENTMVEVMPLLYAVALLGGWWCWTQRGGLAWLLACWAGFLVFAPRHTFRWLSGEGTLGVILLGGVGLHWLSRRWAMRRREHLPAGVALFLLLVASPTAAQTPAGWRWRWPDAAPWHLLNAPGLARKEVDAGFYAPQIERLVEVVLAQSRPGEILWSNAPYVVGLVAALARRPISSAMWSEAGPSGAFDPVAAAHVILWFKLEEAEWLADPALLARYPLTQVADSELAAVFRNAAASVAARPPQAILPLWAALGLAGLAGGLIVWDARRPRHRQPLPL